MKTTIGPSWAAITILKLVGVAPSKLRTPNASAIGPSPFPMLEIMRAISKVRNAGISQSFFRSASIY